MCTVGDGANETRFTGLEMDASPFGSDAQSLPAWILVGDSVLAHSVSFATCFEALFAFMMMGLMLDASKARW